MGTRPKSNLLQWMPTAIEQVLNRLNQAGFSAYLVGGCVRDALLGNAPHDWDICTAARPEEVIACFSDCKVCLTGVRHGTVLVIREGLELEITTFRTEGSYSDHRHPDQVTFVPNLEVDLARRDFTINAMAWHPKEGLKDPFGGQQDLQQQLIRCVGNPAQRFQEDGLRILRGLRFAARYGFSIEEKTGYAMEQCKDLLRCVAAERIWQELTGFLVGSSVKPLLLRYRNVFAVCLPELQPTFDFDQRNPNHCYDVWEHIVCSMEHVAPDLILRLSLLFHDVGKPVCFSLDPSGVGHCNGHSAVSAELARTALHRLRCDHETLQTVVTLVRMHDHMRRFTRKSTCRLLATLGVTQTKQLLHVMEADIKAQAPETLPRKMEALLTGYAMTDAILAANGCFSKRDMALNGSDLLAMGLRQGVLIGQILENLFQLVLDGTLENKREVLLQQATEWMRNSPPDFFPSVTLRRVP